MSLLRLIFESFVHHRRMNLAVALGAMLGTAVLTGALVIGDSMRGSLRSLTLSRLGNIEKVLAPNRFFRTQLPSEIETSADFRNTKPLLVPAILMSVSMENPRSHSRAHRVELIGSHAHLTEFFPQSSSDLVSLSNSINGKNPPESDPADEIDLNEPLADKLGLKEGDEVMLRLPRPDRIPSESALGEKLDTVRSFRLRVRRILPLEGPGRFSLQSNQQYPLNAYVSLAWLQDRLDQKGKINTLLMGKNEPGTAVPRNDSEKPFHQGTGPSTSSVQRARPVKLADLGVSIESPTKSYLDLTSDRMLFEPAVEEAVLASSAIAQAKETVKIQKVFTYLANAISKGKRAIPYSTISAIDFSKRPPFGPFLSSEGQPLPPLGEKEIALNTWAAEDLGAKVGDSIAITYFEPETIQGQIRQRTVEFRLAAIVQLAGLAADRHLTPSVKGMTDELTMANWNPPFPFDAERIRSQDEQYWDDFGPTPKAYVSLATGQKLWGSRFGKTTSLRIALDDQGKTDEGGLLRLKNGLEDEGGLLRLKNDLEKESFVLPGMGFTWQEVREQGLAASQGTTPFNVLFLGFSFFIIVSSLMLVLLLFKLGIERRASEIGILRAVGWSPKRVRQLFFREGMFTAMVGGGFGVPVGVGYAAIMLWGLQTWWLTAIVTPFLRLYVTPESLAIGFFAGFFMAATTIGVAVRKICRKDPRQLLHGQVSTPFFPSSTGKKTKRFAWLELVWFVLLVGNLAGWFFVRRMTDLQTGLFFGVGMMFLLLTLIVVGNRLRRGAIGPAVAVGRGNLFRLAFRNASRHPGRSTLTIGLVASACFLILAVGAFQLDPSQQSPKLASGNGGFSLVGETSQPILANLDRPDGRAALGFSDVEEKIIANCRFVSIRVKSGDDASCLNLFKPRRPRMLGLPTSFLERDGFAWADFPKNCENPWRLLEPSSKEEKSPLPIVLEKNTANYSLNLWAGLGETYSPEENDGLSTKFQVAALLDNSIFQGDLLVAESELLRRYPEIVGYRFFLVEIPDHQTAAVQKILEYRLGDYGFVAETTGQRLARFLAVQNTYLSTFQSLGSLGLLLGTFGLAVVQLRNLVERRGELALLRAVGFSSGTLARLVLSENLLLLLLGLGTGLLASLIAVVPHFLTSNVPPPWLTLGGVLLLVFLTGFFASLFTVRQVLKTPLLPALREE